MNALEYLNGILAQDRATIGKAISLLESTREQDQELAKELFHSLYEFEGRATRIGISGVPGAGKSTFIESYGKYLTAQGKKLAVLTIDPSSEKSGGSILGDKTRMEELSKDENAFIRPSPSSGTLGGVAAKTREAILIFEAAGYDRILIETVGVGQSETRVADMVDCYLVLMLTGAGDDLQGIKRGILEMADLICVHKADGENKSRALTAKAELKQALHILRSDEIEVFTASSYTQEGIHEIDQGIEKYLHKQKESGAFSARRRKQNLKWMHSALEYEVYRKFLVRAKQEMRSIEDSVLESRLHPLAAKDEILDLLNL